jgi:perosamine synthetase
MSKPQITLSSPRLDGNELKYLQDAIESTWVSSGGPYVGRFEEAVARQVGARHAVATVNGTAALHVALLVAGVQPDDEVLVPALTFVATANAVRYCGAHPVFVDVEPESWTLDPAKTATFLASQGTLRNGRLVNRQTGRRLRALLPVHLLGHPADMDPILETAERFGLTVVEDACEALGAGYKGRAVGSFGRAACFSFNGNKVITAGGGGMVVTDDADVARLARHLTQQARQPGPEYVHDTIGFNYRLTNVCAAVGLAQLERLPEFLNRKREIASAYRAAFSELAEVRCMAVALWAEPTWWLYTILLTRGDADRASRLVAHLAKEGIEARRLWRPLHLLPMYRDSQTHRVEVAERVYEGAVNLPCSVHLTGEQQQRVVGAVREFLHTE